MAPAPLLIIDNLARLSPRDVVREVDGVDPYEEVDERPGDNVHDVAEDVLDPLHEVPAKPEDEGEGVQLGVTLASQVRREGRWLGLLLTYLMHRRENRAKKAGS